MKIFDFNKLGLGSYRDSVSGTLSTNSNGVFRKTEKQYAWRSNGVNTKITLPSLYTISRLSGYIEIWFNGFLKSSSNDILLGYDQTGYKNLRKATTSLILESNTDSDLWLSYDMVSGNNDNNWKHLVVIANGGTVKSYINNILVGTQTPTDDVSFLYISSTNGTRPWDGYIAKVEFGDNILTTQERNNLYKDFLRNKGTGSSIHKNGFPVKNDDLSRISGLIASYNMIPSSGGVLVDTSHSGNNGTINGAISTKDGMAFGGTGVNVTVLDDPTITLGDNYTIAFNTIPYSNQLAFSDFLSKRDVGNWVRFIFVDATKKIRISTGVGTSFDSDISLVDNTQVDIVFIKMGTTGYLYINGILDTSGTVKLDTSSNGDLIIGNYSSSEYNGEINDVRILNKVWSIDEIKQYHNQFVNPVILEDFQNEPVFLEPKEWVIDSGIFLVYEDTTGNKYAQCDSNSVSKIFYKGTLLGTASIDYYDGSTWTTYEDTLENLISTHSWLSHDGQYLIFTLTSGDRIDNIKITNGIKQL